MTIETEIAALTTATTDLLNAVNVRKTTLDAKVTAASTSADSASVSAGVATTKALDASLSAAQALTVYSSVSAQQTAVATAVAKATEATNAATQAAASAASASALVLGVSSGLPDIFPSLNLDFANSKVLDPRITFSRSSLATYYDGKTMAKAEENLLPYSQDFGNAAWAKTNATITSDVVAAPDGLVTADFLVDTADATGHRLSFNGPTQTANTIKTFSVFAKAGTSKFLYLYFAHPGTNTIYAGAVFDVLDGILGQEVLNSGAIVSKSVTAVGNGWYRCSITASTNSGLAQNAAIGLAPALTNNAVTDYGQLAYVGTGAGLYIWGAQLEQRAQATAYTLTTTQPITNYIPIMQTAAANVARFDHNPITGDSLGLLIEEQRTNLVLRSEEFTATSWQKNLCNIYADQIVAPDGTLSADLAEFLGSGQINSSGSVATVSGAHTFSFFVKPYAGLTGTSQFLIRNSTTGTNLLIATIAWSTMTVNANGSITALPNGWYRLSITATTGISAGDLIIGYPISGATVGLKFFLWGAQLEAGAFPTSYIKTGASQVTRAFDSAQLLGNNFSSWYRQDEGTMYVEYVQGPSNDTQPAFAIDDSSSNNRLNLYADATVSASVTPGFHVSSGGNAYVSNNHSSTIAGSINKFAAGYALNNFASALNSNLLTDSTGSVPVVDRASIGRDGASATRSMNGRIKRIVYYSKRLTDAQLQAITT